MRIDVTPLLKRLVLAGLPLSGGCYCQNEPTQAFESTVALHEETYEYLQPGVARWDGGARPDGAPPYLSPLSETARAQYAACIADRARCRDLCVTLATDWWRTALEIQTCELVDNGTTRPDVHIAGRGSDAACGRRPAGLCPPASAPGSPIAIFLAEAAHLEAASVTAFHRLADELAAHGAPPALCRAAKRAARDERRHARVVGALARAAGATPAPVEVAPARRRTLLALAEENAAEGCVRETFGALLAWWQAATAEDAAVRRVARQIAPDESRHANLAWQIDAWAHGRLGPRARQRLRAARAAAAFALGEEWRRERPDPLRRRLGLPDVARAARLLDGLAHGLWRAPGLTARTAA